MSKSLAIQVAQRRAYERLSKKYFEQIKTHVVQDKQGRKHEVPLLTGGNGAPQKEYVYNDWYVTPANITCPSPLAQEQPLDGSTNILTFDFSITAPQKTPTLNNITLGQNDVSVSYGIAVYFGVGATGNSRTYYTHGLVAGDNVLYQGATMSIQFEQSQSIKNINMLDFLYVENTYFKPEEVVKLINPLRILNGKLGTFTVTINMQPVTGLAFTPNAWVRVELQAVLGQAQGTN